MVIVHFDNGLVGKIDGYKWAASPEWFESWLNDLLVPDGPTGWDPDPDLGAAMAAIEKFGGQIKYHDKLDRVKGRVY